MAYTVSTYLATSGPCKGQVNANLHIHFGVVLHEPVVESADEVSDAGSAEEVSGDEAKDVAEDVASK